MAMISRICEGELKQVAFNKFPAVKYDEHGKMTVMARSGGYVMARRPGSVPFVKAERDWLRMSDTAPRDDNGEEA